MKTQPEGLRLLATGLRQPDEETPPPNVSVSEREAWLRKLKLFFENVADGEEVSWMRVEEETGISMHAQKGFRQLARAALHRLERPWDTVHGKGVRMSSADSALPMLERRCVKINNGIQAAGETHRQLQVRHLEQMNPRDKEQMLRAGALFGAVRVSMNQAPPKALKG